MVANIILFIILIVIIILFMCLKIIISIYSMKFKLSEYIYIGLNKYQLNYLIISLILYLLLFYYLKSFIVDIDLGYILLIGIFYAVWYFLTKILTNTISKSPDLI